MNEKNGVIAYPAPSHILVVVGNPSAPDPTQNMVQLTGAVEIRFTLDALLAVKLGKPSKGPLTFYPKPHQFGRIGNPAVAEQLQRLIDEHTGEASVPMRDYPLVQAWVLKFHAAQQPSVGGTPTPALPMSDPMAEDVMEALNRG